jgi:hypothetical protein
VLPAYVIYIGAALNLAGTATYVLDTFRGRVQPNRITWFIWALAPFITFAAQLSKGVGIEALTTFMAGFMPLLIFLASFVNKNAYWKASRFDWICGGVSLVALALWAVSGEGLVAIGLAIAADALAAVPTVIKAYQEPSSESPTAYITAGVSGLLTLLTLSHWTLANAGFSLYLVALCSLISVLLLVPRRLKESHS